MRLDILIIFTIVALELVLSFFVYFKGSQRVINRLFFLFTFTLILWGASNFLVDEVALKNIAYITVRSDFALAPILTTLFLLFCIVFPKNQITRVNKIVGYITSCLAIIFSLSVLSTDYIVSGVSVSSEGIRTVYGELELAYNLFIFLTLTMGIASLSWKAFHSRGIIRQQIFYVGIGLGITAIAALVANVVIPYFVSDLSARTVYTRLGNYGAIFFIASTSYAIIAHRLFDIRVIIRRTVVYSGLLAFALATYSIVIFIFTQFFGGTEQPLSGRTFVSNLMAATLIALGIEPLRKWLTNVTDRFLFKGEYDPQEVVHELAQFLGDVTDLDEALETMMKHVVKHLRLAHAAAIVIRPHIKQPSEPEGENAPKFEVHRIKQVGYKDPGALVLEPNDIFIEYFTESKQMVVTEELEQVNGTSSNDSVEHQLLKKLNRLKVVVTIPMIVRNKVIGIVTFGEKLSGDPFLNQDLDLLQIIATQTASAIEKARLYEEDQLKSEFVSIASHELLTPTAAIEGYLSMILDEHLVEIDEKAREYLTRIYMSSRRLSQLVKDLLSVSRIEGGRMVIDRQAVSVTTIIEQVVNDLVILAKEKGITINWVKPKQTIPDIFVDREKTIQVVVNLVSNAIKYNRPKGNISIKVQPAQKMVSISVADTGVGMTKEETGKLFEKFYRTKIATESAIQGSGLGLYISKKLVELMDGIISVTSEVGKGSTFTVTLPAANRKNKRIITGDPKLMSPDQKIYVKKTLSK